ncbi:hypothetical protein FB45DRAFT_828945 [Roridomyces roridus]|uniref:Uncharacterized protein n=1 Tax=Roridomyces roridus TaxID=1738132 RepID=A0AAD7FTM6_9AGAR|nr:hypothetical protein FB45DRAFT_828945 [Roridomyces roridus]
MSALNHTIDDISPLIQYAGDWRQSTPASDPEISQYLNTTFTTCNTAGSSATFTFNGTAIWIFGAKRPNHGQYRQVSNCVVEGGSIVIGFSVSLDSTVTILHGHADPPIYQTPIFTATNLADTTHTIIITNQQVNASRSYLDLDFITWTSTPRKGGKQTTTLHSSESDFSYAPQAAWSTNSTASSTSSDQASVLLTFMVAWAARWGVPYSTVGPDSGAYTVSIDNGQPSTSNANKLNTTNQVPLFFASALGPGNHTLNITNTPRQGGQVLGIDYAVAARADAASAVSGYVDGSIAFHSLVYIRI